MQVLGEMAPDLPDVATPGIVLAQNLRPVSVGYRTYPSLVSLFGQALNGQVRGARAGRDHTGNGFNTAGTATDLFMERNGVINPPPNGPSGPYSTPADGYWALDQYRAAVFATNYNDEVQVFDLRTDTAYVDLSSKAASSLVPKARHLAVIKQFLVLGDVNDTVNTTDGVVRERIHWGPVNDPLGVWPAVGTDAAKGVQSDKQDFTSGGAVNRILSLGEIGLVFLERRIERMDYVGGATIFAFDPVEEDRGCIAPGACAASGRRAFYLAEDGFWMTDGSSSIPIGESKVNRFFWEDFDPETRHLLSCEADPRDSQFVIAYCATGHVGRPNRALIYDWTENKWSALGLNVDLLTRSLPSTDSIDDVPPYGGNLDTDYPDSFDSTTQFGFPYTLSAYDAEHRLAAFTGPPLDALLVTGDYELAGPNYTALLNGVRPVTGQHGGSVNIAIATRQTQDDAPFIVSTSAVPNVMGMYDVRASGRYHRATLIFSGMTAHADIEALDVDFTRDGMR